MDTTAAGSSSWLPLGLLGIWAAFPFGMWFFLGVEGVPLAAEEAKDPVRSMPRALSISMGILVLLALLTFLASTGARGADAIKDAGNPLVVALDGNPGLSWLKTFVNYAGLAGLVASFFSLIYAGSRQLFALSRAGYLPRFLSSPRSARPRTWACSSPARSASRSPRPPGTARACSTSRCSARRSRTR